MMIEDKKSKQLKQKVWAAFFTKVTKFNSAKKHYVNSLLMAGGGLNSAGRLLNLTSFFWFVFLAIEKNEQSQDKQSD